MSKSKRTPNYHVRSKSGECWIWVSSKSLKIVVGNRGSDGSVNVTARFVIPIDVVVLDAMAHEQVRRRLLKYIIALDSRRPETTEVGEYEG